MAKNCNKTLKFRAVLFLTALLLIFSSIFLFSACNDEEEKQTEDNKPSITYPSANISEDEEELKLNIPYGTFESGTYKLSTTSFPYGSVNGWSIGKESYAPTSGYNHLDDSGLIDKANWDSTLEHFNEEIENFNAKLPTKETIFDATRGNRVIILNAYAKNNLATSTKATRSSSITLEKNSKYEIKVDVMTANLTTNSGEGANVQILSTVNGVSKTNIINGIDTNGTWQTYTIYVETDEFVSTSVKLALGLGRAGANDKVIENCIQGTAFFDNVVVNKVDAISGATPLTSYDYNSEDATFVDKSTATTYSINYKASPTLSAFDTATNKTVAPNNYYLVKAVATITEGNTAKVSVKEFDSNSTDAKVVKTTEVKTFSYDKDNAKQIYYFLVQNNYVNATDLTQYFNVEAESGITLSFVNGAINEENADYKFYSSLAGNKVALYNGYSADYVKTEEPTPNYAFTPATTETVSDTTPCRPKNYMGVSDDSTYISDKSTNASINTKTNSGLIKVKNFENKDTQAIQITNANESYGFIANAYNTVNASGYATVSLKAKVDASAKAFIYIIDKDTNQPMVFEYTNSDNEKVTKTLVLEVGNTNGWKDINFYIATGANKKSFRVEMWNGSRDGATKTTGTVLFDAISINTSAGSFESARQEDLLITGTLGKLIDNTNETFETVKYTRKLTENETKFNKEYADKTISYKENYIWANSPYTVYAVYNTIDPVESNPYDTVEKDEEDTASCKSNPGSFWLSFSSIALVAVMILALIAIIVKNALTKKKLNASDAKSHYKVQSRTSKKKAEEKKQNKQVVEETAQETQEDSEETDEETTEEIENAEVEEVVEEEKTETLNEYVYGDVQNFGEELETNEEKAQETTEEITSENQPSEETTSEETKVEETTTETTTEEVKEESESKPDNE